MSEPKNQFTWDDAVYWVGEHPMLTAFLSALVIVIILGAAFLISWQVGVGAVVVGVVLAVLTFIIYSIIEFNSF